jgi:spore germination cell wall hydrolase CwlJ-like protein
MNAPTILALLAMLNQGYDYPVDLAQAGCMATAIYHESAGEPIECKAAIANVITNRMAKRNLSACDVIYEPYQFSYTLLDPEELIHREARRDNATQLALWESSIVALQALTSGLDIHQATHYYNPSIVSPKWASAFKHDFTCGGHKFVY